MFIGVMLLHELVIFVRQSRRKQNRRFWWKTRFFFSSHKRPLTYRWRSPTDTIFGVKQPEHRAARPLVFLPRNHVCGLFTLGSLNKRGFRYRVVEVTFFFDNLNATLSMVDRSCIFIFFIITFNQ